MIIFIIIIAIVLFIVFRPTPMISTFNEKMNLLKEAYSKNEEFSNFKNNQKEPIIILSVCNNEEQAIVRSEKSSSFYSSYHSVKNKIKQYIKTNTYSPELVKIDFAIDIQEFSMEDFETELASLEQEYEFLYGIILSYQNREDIILTEPELNANNIIDYENCELNLKNLNTYLNFREEKTVTSLPTTLKVFTTISYFCDEQNQVYELDFTGKRKYDNFEQSDIDFIIQNATYYLTNMIKEDGEFIYGYYPLTNKENEDYNILRHAGSLWSLIVTYTSELGNKEKIDSSLDYLIGTITYANDDVAYIQEIKSNEIKLGGNALSIIALCEYTDKFKEDKYLNLIEKLGNGILNMQNENGSYNHVLNADTFSLKEEYRTVYYDGEATFALCKLYNTTKNKKYLDAAEKSIQYFIEKNYTQYSDHWISYAVNELIKYTNNVEYYEFGLKNVYDNLESIYSKPYTSHIDFEMLLQCFELYNRILENEIQIENIENYPLEDLTHTIEYRAQFQLNSYLYPEIAMYLKEPSKYSNTFYIRHSNYRIRIDDIQHSILGYYFYSKNFQEIEQKRTLITLLLFITL